LGPQRAGAFINVAPVTMFVLAALLGDRPAPLEIAGAVLTIVALLGDNLLCERLAVSGRKRSQGEPARLAPGKAIQRSTA
jgi:hypothetical protein